MTFALEKVNEFGLIPIIRDAFQCNVITSITTALKQNSNVSGKFKLKICVNDGFEILVQVTTLKYLI